MHFNFLKIFVSSVILISGLSQSSIAAPRCAILISETNVAATTSRDVRSQIRKQQKVSFSPTEKSQITEIISAFGIARFSDHLDLLNKLTVKIARDELPPIEKADKLAQIGLKIQNILDKRIPAFFDKYGLYFESDLKYKLSDVQISEELKTEQPTISEADLKAKTDTIKTEYAGIRRELVKSHYNLGEKIAKLEAFKVEEYEVVETHALNKPGYTLVTLSEYPQFAMSLALRTAPPREYGTGGVVSLPEYRDVVSNNLWLFTLAGHDLKHIHYANSHPFAMGSIFRATRSKNHLRYFLMAALYEGVDTVQYSFETAQARHFSAKGYTLEEGLVYLASATLEQLQEVARAISVTEDHSYLSQFRNWKPRRLKPELLPAHFKKVEQLEEDILNAMFRSFTDLANPNVNYFMRPDLIPEGIAAPEGTAQKPGDVIHHN